MKTSKNFVYAIAISLVVNQAYAQYEINKHSVNSGGGKISGGGYELNNSIGQGDASTRMSNGTYSLVGGFWHENNNLIFKNNFE